MKGIQEMRDVHSILYLRFHFHSASLLKQQSTGKHAAPLGHIILIPNQPVFTLSP
jgi:hypothetical protein